MVGPALYRPSLPLPGLVASQAEEEAAADGSDAAALLRLDAWAASLRPESVLASPGGSVVTLGDSLASVCVPLRPVSVAAAAGMAKLAAAGGSAGGAGAGGGGAGGAGVDMAPLQRAHVCWRWVVTHVAGTAALGSTWDVEQPLFGSTPQVGGGVWGGCWAGEGDSAGRG